MIVSDTSIQERQNQMLETKQVVNQLEEARQKQLNIYYNMDNNSGEGELAKSAGLPRRVARNKLMLYKSSKSSSEKSN